MSPWGWENRHPDSAMARAAVAKLSEPLFCLPAQMPRSVVREPETCLALAVIERAIDDLRGIGGANVRASIHAAHDARRWVASDSLEPYSFAVLCHAVGLSADALRHALLAIPELIPNDPAFWTTEQMATLRELYPDHEAGEIAHRLGRTAKSVEYQVHRLGLRKRPVRAKVAA